MLCDDDASDTNLFELIATMLQRVLDNNSNDYVGNRWGAYTEQARLSSSEKSDIESKIRKCKTKNCKKGDIKYDSNGFKMGTP